MVDGIGAHHFLLLCAWQVLVVRAENLPTVREGEGGAEVPPDTFVSAASLREVRGRTTPKAVTRTVSGSQNPAWGEVLEVRRGRPLGYCKGSDQHRVSE